MKTQIKLTTYFLLSLSLLILSGCSKYAVLVSTNKVTHEDVSYHSEWWYDTFLMYQALRESGFQDKNIYVLYGDGIDFDTTYNDYNAIKVYGHNITDMAVNKANIQSIFNTLSNKVGGNDHLYVYWMGHGGGSGPGSCNLTMDISYTGETVTDIELANYINMISNYKKRTIDIMTCHSGGMLDNMDVIGTDTVTLTSSTCPQSSYSISTTCNGRTHAEFHYTIPNALRWRDPCNNPVDADYNNSGDVSLSEVHSYNAATMTTSTPQMVDPDGIAPNTHLDHIQP
jgi:hypothetical protein